MSDLHSVSRRRRGILEAAACTVALGPVAVRAEQVEVGLAGLAFSGGAASTTGTGVSDGRGTVPRLGETVVNLPITVSALGEVRQAIGLYGAPDRKLDTVLRGRLAGSNAGDLSFEWRGGLAMPLPKGS